MHTDCYRLNVYSNGYVEYFGDYKGVTAVPRIKRIAAERISQLIGEFETADFFSLQERYTRGHARLKDGREITTFSSSMPGTSLRFTNRGRTKTIAFSVGAPSSLLILHAQIINIVGIDTWMKEGIGAR